jgi:hypothetical protein
VSPDRLLDPPARVGRELKSAAPVEPINRLDQADGGLLDQVLHVTAFILVLLGDADGKSEVRFDHLIASPSISGLNALGDLNLLLTGQQISLSNLFEKTL